MSHVSFEDERSVEEIERSQAIRRRFRSMVEKVLVAPREDDILTRVVTRPSYAQDEFVMAQRALQQQEEQKIEPNLVVISRKRLEREELKRWSQEIARYEAKISKPLDRKAYDEWSLLLNGTLRKAIRRIESMLFTLELRISKEGEVPSLMERRDALQAQKSDFDIKLNAVCRFYAKNFTGNYPALLVEVRSQGMEAVGVAPRLRARSYRGRRNARNEDEEEESEEEEEMDSDEEEEDESEEEEEEESDEEEVRFVEDEPEEEEEEDAGEGEERDDHDDRPQRRQLRRGRRQEEEEEEEEEEKEFQPLLTEEEREYDRLYTRHFSELVVLAKQIEVEVKTRITPVMTVSDIVSLWKEIIVSYQARHDMAFAIRYVMKNMIRVFLSYFLTNATSRQQEQEQQLNPGLDHFVVGLKTSLQRVCFLVYVMSAQPEDIWTRLYYEWSDVKQPLEACLIRLGQTCEQPAEYAVARTQLTTVLDDISLRYNNADAFWMVFDQYLCTRISKTVVEELDQFDWLSVRNVHVPRAFQLVTRSKKHVAKQGEASVALKKIHKEIEKEQKQKKSKKPFVFPQVSVHNVNLSMMDLSILLEMCKQPFKVFQNEEGVIIRKPLVVPEGDENFHDAKDMALLIESMYPLLVRKAVRELQANYPEASDERIAMFFKAVLENGFYGVLTTGRRRLIESNSIFKPRLEEAETKAYADVRAAFRILPEQIITVRQTQMARQRRMFRNKRVQAFYEQTDQDIISVTLPRECEEATRHIMIRQVDESIPPRKYVYSRLSLHSMDQSVYYTPSNWFRLQLCLPERDVRTNCFRVDGIAFSLAFVRTVPCSRCAGSGKCSVCSSEGTISALYPFTEQDYLQRRSFQPLSLQTPLSDLSEHGRQQLQRMYLTFEMSCARLGQTHPVCNAFPAMFTELISYSSFTIFQFVSVFVTMLSFYDPAFQLVDKRLQTRIEQSLPTLLSFIRDTATDDVISRLLLVWFHINYQTPMGAEIVQYVTDVVYQYIALAFPFLQADAAFPYLSLFIQADTVEQMATQPMPEGLLDMTPIQSIVPHRPIDKNIKWMIRYMVGRGDVREGYNYLRSLDQFTTDSDIDQDMEHERLIEQLFTNENTVLSPRVEQAYAAQAQPDPFELSGKKCAHCKKGRSLVPTIHLGSLQRMKICPSCATNGRFLKK